MLRASWKPWAGTPPPRPAPLRTPSHLHCPHRQPGVYPEQDARLTTRQAQVWLWGAPTQPAVVKGTAGDRRQEPTRPCWRGSFLLSSGGHPKHVAPLMGTQGNDGLGIEVLFSPVWVPRCFENGRCTHGRAHTHTHTHFPEVLRSPNRLSPGSEAAHGTWGSPSIGGATVPKLTAHERPG